MKFFIIFDWMTTSGGSDCEVWLIIVLSCNRKHQSFYCRNFDVRGRIKKKKKRKRTHVWMFYAGLVRSVWSVDGGDAKFSFYSFFPLRHDWNV